MKRNINSALLVMISIISYTSASAQLVSLDSVLKRIDAANPMLQEYDQRIKAMEAYSTGANSWMAPMVGVGTFMMPYPNQMLMDERDKGSFMFSVEQEIPNPAKLRANRDYLSSRGAVEAESRAIQFNTLRAEAKAIYYKWIVSEKKLRTLKESERIIELMLKLARIRYAYNQGSLGNIYKAEARLHEVNNMQWMTQGDIDALRLRLSGLMNTTPNESMMIDTTLQATHQRYALNGDTTALRTSRSDIRQLEKSIEVMELNQRYQRMQARPDFRIRFDHMQPRGAMPTQYTAMAMVSIPIAPWSSKMYKAEVKGMQYEIEAMKRERDGILLETQRMLAGMASQLEKMQRQLNNYETKIIPALRKNYQTLMLAYEENREQLPMVIDGWEAMNMAQMEYLEKLDEYYTMIVSYEKELDR